MTLYLIRHADAGKRDPYSPDDHLRGLSEDGLRQAARIADRLEGAVVTRVISSPYPRCVQTVEPLAQRAGVDVELDTALAEGADLRRTFALVMALLNTNAVLCSHGDVIPDVLRLLEMSGMSINGKRGNAKGSIWTLTSDGESLLTAAYTKIPREPDALLR